MNAETLDPVSRSVMASALAGIAEEMGSILVRGAYSSNIKERRDCSSAIFDASGRMIAQAAHIPVHLGALPETVAAVIAQHPQPDDVFIVNDPFTGGSHLPDISLVAPLAPDGEIIGYAATRAHHNDVGGMRSGSMPSDSREIYQEGLIIPPVRLVHRGKPVREVLDLVLANVRTPHQREGDLYAQIAAQRAAEERLRELIERRGLAIVLAAFEDLLAYTERRTRAAIKLLPNGEYHSDGEMEGDGTNDVDIPIRVKVSILDESLTIDFAGTSDAVTGNVNCPLAVTRSACFFAIQSVLAKDVPIVNAGTTMPVTVLAPPGCLVNAQAPSAVAAGNVETSQRIADTVLMALAQTTDALAQGQGTMNVIVLGGSDWTYVETVGGGQGAHRHGPGSSGVHVGMTNTLNTPIEALELEYPLRVERCELIYGSGGEGIHHGGDGIIRSLRALERVDLSVLTERRRHAPQGINGGLPGRCGRNLVNDEPLPAKATRELAVGDLFTIETPGGGGWGAPS